MKVDQVTLRGAGFWNRELFYLESPFERPLPKFSFSDIRANDIPDGFVKKSSHLVPEDVRKESSDKFRAAMIENSWSRPVISDCDAEAKWHAAAIEGCSPYSCAEFLTPKFRKLVGLSRNQLWHWMMDRKNPDVFGRVPFKRGRGVWVEEERVVLNDDTDGEEGPRGGTRIFGSVPPPPELC